LLSDFYKEDDISKHTPSSNSVDGRFFPAMFVECKRMDDLTISEVNQIEPLVASRVLQTLEPELSGSFCMSPAPGQPRTFADSCQVFSFAYLWNITHWATVTCKHKYRSKQIDRVAGYSRYFLGSHSELKASRGRHHRCTPFGYGFDLVRRAEREQDCDFHFSIN
jgi:hypothetical protein